MTWPPVVRIREPERFDYDLDDVPRGRTRRGPVSAAIGTIEPAAAARIRQRQKSEARKRETARRRKALREHGIILQECTSHVPAVPVPFQPVDLPPFPFVLPPPPRPVRRSKVRVLGDPLPFAKFTRLATVIDRKVRSGQLEPGTYIVDVDVDDISTEVLVIVTESQVPDPDTV